MMSHPENPPTIDWQYYVNTVPVPGLVEDFKKKYEAVVVPVPNVDPYNAELDNQQKSLEKNIADYKVESEKIIAKCKEDIAKVKALVPLHLMTMEEVCIYHPELGPDRENFYPHFVSDKDMAEPASH